MLGLLSADGYVYTASGTTIVMIVVQIVTILVTGACLGLGIYVLILLVKFLKRGIKYYDMKLQEVETED